MSSFICGQYHFASLRASIANFVSKEKELNCPEELARFFPEWYMWKSERYAKLRANKLVSGLARLNYAAYCHQYKHHQEEGEEVKTGQVWKNAKAYSNIIERGELLELSGLLKALHCLQYQIEEEHLPIRMQRAYAPYIGALDALCKLITYKLATRTAAYDMAQWEVVKKS